MENLTKSLELLEAVIKLAELLGHDTKNLTLDTAYQLKNDLQKSFQKTFENIDKK